MSELHCCLEKRCKAEHSLASNKLYIEKLYQVGKLFDSQPICVWCLLHLQDLTRVPLNERDTHVEELKVRFPNYWEVIQELGIENVRRELGCSWLEIEPDTPVKTPPTIITQTTEQLNPDGSRYRKPREARKIIREITEDDIQEDPRVLAKRGM